MSILRYIIILFFLLNSSPALAQNVIKQLFDQANVAYNDGDYDKSIGLYEKAIEAAPNFAPGYNYLGLAHKARGTDLKEVLWLFKTATELDPNYANAYENLAKVSYNLGEFDQAQEYGLKAVSLDPKSVTAQLALGWIYLVGQSSPNKAIKYFKFAANQEVPLAYYGLGLAYFMDHQRLLVLESITKLRSLNREDLALELENIIRRGDYVAQTKLGEPLIDVLEANKKAEEPKTSYSEAEEKKTDDGILGMPVHLRGAMPTIPGDTLGASIPSASDPSVERIKALQHKRAVAP